jgi:hypothetical protein
MSGPKSKYLGEVEIEWALSLWEAEEERLYEEFKRSLTPEQRELLKKYYRAQKMVRSFRKWRELVKAGKLRKRTIRVPEWAAQDYAYMRLARGLGFPPEYLWRLKEVVMGLSETERLVLEVCYGLKGGKPPRLSQAAYRLGMPPTTVKVIRDKALERVKARLRR